MIALDIPGCGTLGLTDLVLDVNGTISLDGRLIEGVAERVGRLCEDLTIHMLTADTRGTASEIAAQLSVHCRRVTPGREREDKLAFVEALGAEHVVAVGNGNNDVDMLRASGLGIAVLGKEGCAVAAIQSAHIVVADVSDALDMLLEPRRIIATLRH